MFILKNVLNTIKRHWTIYMIIFIQVVLGMFFLTFALNIYVTFTVEDKKYEDARYDRYIEFIQADENLEKKDTPLYINISDYEKLQSISNNKLEYVLYAPNDKVTDEGEIYPFLFWFVDLKKHGLKKDTIYILEADYEYDRGRIKPRYKDLIVENFDKNTELINFKAEDFTLEFKDFGLVKDDMVLMGYNLRLPAVFIDVSYLDDYKDLVMPLMFLDKSISDTEVLEIENFLRQYSKVFTLDINSRTSKFNYIFSGMRYFYDDLYSIGIFLLFTVVVCLFTIYYKIISSRKKNIGVKLSFGVKKTTVFLEVFLEIFLILTMGTLFGMLLSLFLLNSDYIPISLESSKMIRLKTVGIIFLMDIVFSILISIYAYSIVYRKNIIDLIQNT